MSSESFQPRATHRDDGPPRPSRLPLLALVPLLGFVLCLRALAAGDLPWDAG